MPFACEVCGAIIGRRCDLLNRHALLHMPDAPTHLCPYPDCDRSINGFAQKSNLKTHINARHTNSSEKRWHKCRYGDCGMVFADRSSLNRHQKSARIHRNVSVEHRSQRHVTEVTKKLKEKKVGKGVDKRLAGVGRQFSSSSTPKSASSSTTESNVEREVHSSNVPPSPTYSVQSPPTPLPAYNPTVLSPSTPASEFSLLSGGHVDLECLSTGSTPFSSDSDLSTCASTLSFPSTPLSPFMTDFFSVHSENGRELGTEMRFFEPDLSTATFRPGFGYPAIDVNAWLLSTEGFANPLTYDFETAFGLELSSDNMGPWTVPSQKAEDKLSETNSLDPMSDFFDFDAWDTRATA